MNKRNALIATGLILAAAASAAWFAFRPTGKGNIHEALAADMAKLDEQQMLPFVSKINLEGSTPRQRLELFNRLKARFDSMTLVQRLSIVLAMRRIYEKDPNDPLMANGRLLMQEYWAEELKKYMDASAEERAKMIDARIDESLIYENVQKLGDAAKSLVGMKVEEPDVRQIQTEIVRAISESMKNRPPEERARAAQYFLDMRERRVKRGLKVLF